MNQSSESKIDRLRRRLDSQNRSDDQQSGNQLSYDDGGNDDIPTSWEHEEMPPEEPEKKMSFLDKLLIFAGIFFIAAFAFTVYSIGFDNNSISPDNVLIEIDSPSSVSAGDTATFDINIRNQNEVELQNAQLVIVYPSGTRESENTGQELRQDRAEVGTIPANGSADFSSEATLFGERGDMHEISVQLEYRVQDSNAIFLATNKGEIEISEAPISLDISSPTEGSVNELFTMELSVRSNASRRLDDVVLVADYPFGFTANEINPTPNYRDYVWQLGDIEPGDEKEIEIAGRFTNVNASDQQAFRFDVGTAQVDEDTQIGTLFASQDVVVNLREAFMNVALDLSTSRDQRRGTVEVSGEIDWQSNLESTVRGGELTATFSGAGFNSSTLVSRNGIVRSSENTITWNSRTNDSLETINPGNNDTKRFNFNTLSTESLVQAGENQSIDIAILMEAQSSNDSSLPEVVTTNMQESIKLPTLVNAQLQTLYEDGPFVNTGPVPPRVDEPTTYTLKMSVTNTTNEITDASFQAALPAYVEFIDTVSPASADVTYNDISGRLTWDIGTLPAGAGFTRPPEEVYVQVEILPTSSQAGSRVRLLADPSVSGTDSFTGEMIQLREINVPTTDRNDARASGDGQIEN